MTQDASFSSPRFSDDPTCSVEEGFDVFVGIKFDEIVGTFAKTNKFDGDTQFGLDRKRNATLGRAVELGKHYAGEIGNVAELFGLDQTVLACRGVEH